MTTASKVRASVSEAIKSVVFRHTTLGAPKYEYCIEPIQLATLINEYERTRGVVGSLVEIGVARGMTTRFLCEHVIRQGDERVISYFALDTFSSFLESDVEHEINIRGKDGSKLHGFSYNDYNAWKRNFEPFPFVKAIVGDCSTFDYGSIGPIRMAFLDVDLYLPTKGALSKIYALLSDGGTIVVDDVQDRSIYDGAYQAYVEFCEEMNLKPEIIGNRCGIVRK